MKTWFIALTLVTLLSVTSAPVRPSCTVSPPTAHVLEDFTISARNLPVSTTVNMEEYFNYLGGERYYAGTVYDIPTDASGNASVTMNWSLSGMLTVEFTNTDNTVDYVRCNEVIK